jgi:hypothetical protein
MFVPVHIYVHKSTAVNNNSTGVNHNNTEINNEDSEKCSV